MTRQHVSYLIVCSCLCTSSNRAFSRLSRSARCDNLSSSSELVSGWGALDSEFATGFTAKTLLLGNPAGRVKQHIELISNYLVPSISQLSSALIATTPIAGNKGECCSLSVYLPFPNKRCRRSMQTYVNQPVWCVTCCHSLRKHTRSTGYSHYKISDHLRRCNHQRWKPNTREKTFTSYRCNSKCMDEVNTYSKHLNS